MKQDKYVSGALILVALAVAGPMQVWETAQGVIPVLLLAGVLLGVLASVLNAFKSKFLVKKITLESLEYARDLNASSNIQVTGNEQVMNMLSKFKQGFTKEVGKTVGKAVLISSRVMEFGLLVIGGFCALVFFFFRVSELFGLWIILSTVFLVVLFKFSDLFAFFLPSRQSFSSKTKQTLAWTGLMGVGVWVLSCFELWFLFESLSQVIPGANGFFPTLTGLFFAYGLFTVFSLTPFTFDGIGVIEIVGMLWFWLLGVPMAAGLVCLLVLDASKLLGDFSVSLLPPEKADFSKYR
jgi:hypothetical protein